MPPLGARITPDGVAFGVWAPNAQRVRVEFESADVSAVPLLPGADGFHTGESSQARTGLRYWYVLEDGTRIPDPYSRYQPEGPEGPSAVVDCAAFRWTDSDWRGIDPDRAILYELHIGTFTRAGTFRAAADELPRLADLGITCLELMPIAEFAGRWGWGYDGVHWFAPFHHYGTPEDLAFLVDRAHALGLGVILDVVYNHVGSEGNSLPQLSELYFTEEHATDWGKAFNYAHPVVRRLAIDNAVYWIRELHFDGLRLDAIQGIHEPRLFAELAQAAHQATPERNIMLTAEDYLQRSHLLAEHSFQQIWNDDYHHSLRVALTGNRDGYFRNYRGDANEILAAVKHGFLFQGQYDAHLGAPRGEPSINLPPCALIVFTQNHDQVANTPRGRRIHELTSPGKKRAMTALLLLGPNTPLIFMGQELDCPSPFLYFADYSGNVAAAVEQGRLKEGEIFSQSRDPEVRRETLDPCDERAFVACKLETAGAAGDTAILRLYRALISLRRRDPVLAARPHVKFDGIALTRRAFVLRWFDRLHGDRLLVVNLGNQIGPQPSAQPLLAPPHGQIWHTVLTTDEPRYGGSGRLNPARQTGWHITPESAHFLISIPVSDIRK